MTNIGHTLWRALLFCFLAAFANPAIRAATPDLAAERQAALAEADKASQHGPQTVQLRAQATLSLPKGFRQLRAVSKLSLRELQAANFNFGWSPALAARRTSRSRLN